MSILELVAQTYDNTVVVHHLGRSQFILHLGCYVQAKAEGRVLSAGTIATRASNELDRACTCIYCQKSVN